MTMRPDSNARSGSGAGRRYRHPPRPVHFAESAPMPETKAHFENRKMLYDILQLRLAKHACIGSSQFVYFDAGDPRKCAAPDVFVRLGSEDRPFRTWKVWEWGAPDVAVEIISDDDRAETTRRDKLARYLHLGVRELVCFDAEDADEPLRVWDRVEGDFVERALEAPRTAECGPLGLYWVVVDDPSRGRMLRLSIDAAARQLLPTSAEAAELARRQAEQAQQQAERALKQVEAERDELRRQVGELTTKPDRSG